MDDLIARLSGRAADPVTAIDMAHMYDAPPARYAPADATECAAAEQRLGFQLPEPVRRVYTTVANGGFGPGYGLMGLIGGAPLDTGDSAVSLFENFRDGEDPEDPLWNWPAGLLPVCHWGCAIYSCVDCTQPDGPVVRFDPNGHALGEPWGAAFRQESESFEAWLGRWLAGTLPFELAT